jgi:hypothetical protein
MAQGKDAVSKADTLVDVREHKLYCGVTMTGKTTLAREHAHILESSKYSIAVYDPVGTDTANGNWPDSTTILRTPEEFADWIDDNEDSFDEEHPCFLFVDESADIFGHSQTQAHWIARKIRHCHIFLRIIVQRPNMLHPSVRTQCAYVYMLRLSRNDAAMICQDMGHGPEVSNTPLDKGDCILLTSGTASIEQFNVFELIGVDPDAEANTSRPGRSTKSRGRAP